VQSEGWLQQIDAGNTQITTRMQRYMPTGTDVMISKIFLLKILAKN
jgi:hypothetical protein